MLPPVFTPVLRLARNTSGRDFVVGDLHGAFGLLVEALQRVAFDVTRDRLLCVGDLVDRGPDNVSCLALLHEPWVWSVRGNHEQMALDVFAADGTAPADDVRLAWMQGNGMGWWLRLSPKERVPLLALACRLPFALEVDTPRGVVGIVHADIPKGMDWPAFTSGLAALESRTLQTCIWGRQRLEGDRHEGVAGVGRVYVGHTPQWGRVRRFGNVYAVDTGAVFGQQGQHAQGALSLTNLLACTNATVLPRATVNLVNVLDDEVPDRPFGQGVGYTSLPSSWLPAWARRG